MRRGSITIYLSLIMTVMIALLSAVFYSVRVQAGRMQLANSVDQALYSTFAQYDRDLLRTYDVFFIDGSCGTGELRPLVLTDRITDAMRYILQPTRGLILGGKSLLSLSPGEGNIAGYTLATDVTGQIFASAAIGYMKETIGAQGVSEILGRVSGNASTTKAQEAQGEALLAPTDGSSYSRIEAEAAEARAANESLRAEGDQAAEEAAVRADEASAEYENPLPAIERLRQMSLMELVLGDASSVSQKSIEGAGLLRDRAVSSGIGVIRVPDNTQGASARLLYNEYILSHFGNFLAPTENSALSYQAEYILSGGDTDLSNLESVVKKLLLTREAANILFLSSDPAKRAEIEACQMAVASMLFIPYAAPVIGALITAGWAFCESIVDVRSLLKGNRTALIKSAETWQVDLRAIPRIVLPDVMGSMERDVPGGVSYTDYLRFYLFLADMAASVKRSLDMVESTIRGMGRPSFRLDTCIYALTFHTSVLSEHRRTWTTEQTMSYSDFSG